MRKAVIGLAMVCAVAWAQHKNGARPEFKDYTVEQVYTGAPAAPTLCRHCRGNTRGNPFGPTALPEPKKFGPEN
ncbi:MAG TPA: hypothetical protein VFL34_14650 [Candidatus Sulfotelmatobacter sp.]|nr:hypothetical protein [Candidatus Sulfotelmatobacter sp.]